MSEPLSLDPTLATEALKAVEVSFHTQYIAVVSITFLLYDYFLNLSNEVNWIWRAPKKCTFSVILYTLNRYISILAAPPVVFRYFWRSRNLDRLETCLHLTRFHYYIIFCSQALVAAVLIQRAYALYGKSRWVLAGTCTIALLAGILGILSVIKAPTESFTPEQLIVTGTCILPTTASVVSRYMPSIITAMLLEVAVFVLTLLKSIQHFRSGSRLLELLLRDGVFYFAAVMLAHFGVILSYYLPHDYSRGNFAILANCLNSTLISRLILHLRDPALLSHLRADQRQTQGIHSTVVLTTSPGTPGRRTNSTVDVSFGSTFDDDESVSRFSDKRRMESRYWYSREDVLDLSNSDNAPRAV